MLTPMWPALNTTPCLSFCAAIALQERRDYVAAERNRKNTESAHELVTDIETMLRRVSARRAEKLQPGGHREQRSKLFGGPGGAEADLTALEDSGHRDGEVDGRSGGDQLCVSSARGGGAHHDRKGASLANLEAALKAAAAACDLPEKLRAYNAKLRTLLPRPRPPT
jgi:hypothetical protein